MSRGSNLRGNFIILSSASDKYEVATANNDVDGNAV